MPRPRAVRAPRTDLADAQVYTPPATVSELSSAEAGITNGLLLRLPTLFLAGDRELLRLPAVAIVGSRAASVDGCRRAHQLARDLVAAGVVVMSGLAAGIDGAAHRSALEHGGRTIGVIATPLDKAYPPEHAHLQEEIYRRHLLLSPFASGTKTTPRHFPERNRVMARLSLATVIVEAGDTSGSLHQALEALTVGRLVFIAQSVARDPKLTWPRRFLDKPGVHELASSADVIRRIS